MIHNYHEQAITPNCQNIVMEKMKKEKAKWELIMLMSLMNSFAAFAHGRRTCLLEFAIVLKLKNNKKTFQRGNATAVNESTLRMWLD